MRTVRVLASGMLAASLLAATPAMAGGNGNGNGNSGSGGSLPLCKLSDLSVAASACAGFFQGNLLSNSSADVDAQTDALSELGLTEWTLAEPQLNLGSSTVNFSTALNGVTYVGLHFGAGAASPSPGTSGGVTAFYRFDAGANLDTFTLAYGSASAARLYSTQAPTIPVSPTPPSILTPPGGSNSIIPVPEPTTWLLMIAGFGAAGAVLRARRRAAA